MMNTTNILQDSWNLMLRYKALWIFGVILAMTTLSFGSTLWLRDSNDNPDRTLVNWEISHKDKAWIKQNFGLDVPLRYTLKVDDLQIRLDDPSLAASDRVRLLNITLTIMVVLFILLVVTLVLRYTAEAALIYLVNSRLDNNEEHGARKGWAFGFSFAGFRLFLIDLLVGIVLLMLTPMIFLPPLLPLLIAIQGSPVAITSGLMLMTSLTLVSLAALIVMWIAGLVTIQLAHRASCLEGLGVLASIWRGFRLMRHQLRGVGLTWLLIVGLDLVYPLLLAPVAILLAAVSLTVSGFLALILGSLLALVLAKATAWTIAFITGIVLMVLAVVLPLTLVDGLREVFKSSVWTLTFREAVRNQSIKSPSTPQKALPQMSSA